MTNKRVKYQAFVINPRGKKFEPNISAQRIVKHKRKKPASKI